MPLKMIFEYAEKMAIELCLKSDYSTYKAPYKRKQLN